MVLAVAAGLATQLLPATAGLQARRMFANLGPIAQGVALAGVLVVISAVIGGQGVAPFIYYRF